VCGIGGGGGGGWHCIVGGGYQCCVGCGWWRAHGLGLDRVGWFNVWWGQGVVHGRGHLVSGGKGKGRERGLLLLGIDKNHTSLVSLGFVFILEP